MLSDHKILVVDDDPAIRRMIERLLGATHRVTSASKFAPALELASKNHFSLALVDVQLADSDGDGYALCRRLRETNPRTEVILVTGSVSHPDEKLYRSLVEDAFYFLFKPFDRRVLLALVERCLRLQQEREAKERYAEALADDFAKAQQFQRSLLPREAVVHSGWRVEGRHESCDALGGDLYLAHPWEDGVIDFAMSDVVGHGVSAAMYAGMLRSSLDAARRRSIDPERISRRLLDSVDYFDGRRYATLVYGNLLPDGKVRYFNAAHPPPLVSSDAGLSTLEPTGGLVCSLFRDKPPTVAETNLQVGDRVLIYTDGAFETKNAADLEFGRGRLGEIFTETRTLPLGDALDALLLAVKSYAGGRPIDDDITLLLLERAG